MNKKRLCCPQIAAVALLFLSFRVTTLAHQEDYIDETLVFQTVEEGAIEPEYWFDYDSQRSDSLVVD